VRRPRRAQSAASAARRSGPCGFNSRRIGSRREPGSLEISPRSRARRHSVVYFRASPDLRSDCTVAETARPTV
jgi:hypothetical protein